MALDLNSLVAVGESGVSAVLDIVSDVKAGIAAGGGVGAEAIAVAEALFADAKFKADVAALVSALKAL